MALEGYWTENKIGISRQRNSTYKRTVSLSYCQKKWTVQANLPKAWWLKTEPCMSDDYTWQWGHSADLNAAWLILAGLAHRSADRSAAGWMAELALAGMTQQHSDYPDTISSSSGPAWACCHCGNRASRKQRCTRLPYRPGLRTGTQLFQIHSSGQSKSQAQPRFKGWGKRPHLLMGRTTKSNCKQG